MPAKEAPSVAELQEMFDYNPADGLLYWRPRENRSMRWHTRYACKAAGCVNPSDGYMIVSFVFGGRKQRFYAHRLIWKLAHNEEPDQIDHVDGNRTNNRLFNLRSVTEKENHRNVRRSSANTSGATGVIPDRRYGGWIAQIKVNRRDKYLGKFYAFEDAVTARKAAERKYGFHPNHGS